MAPTPQPPQNRWEAFAASGLLFTFLVVLGLAYTHDSFVLWAIAVAVLVFGIVFLASRDHEERDR